MFVGDAQQVMKFAEITQEVQVARPQDIYLDIGLTPGRRRMHQLARDAPPRKLVPLLLSAYLLLTNHCLNERFEFIVSRSRCDKWLRFIRWLTRYFAM